MTEVITAIEEIENYQAGEFSWSRQDGFRITTTEQEIWLGIDNSQSCCESWGYLLSEDDPHRFIGAALRSVEKVDTNRMTRKIQTRVDWRSGERYDDDAVYLDDGEAMFIDLVTDRGTLQFAAYNSHNGYYGHSVTVASKQLALEATL